MKGFVIILAVLSAIFGIIMIIIGEDDLETKGGAGASFITSALLLMVALG